MSTISDNCSEYCPKHEWWDPNAYYTEEEIIKQLDEQGYLDCPMCLIEIVGIEA